LDNLTAVVGNGCRNDEWLDICLHFFSRWGANRGLKFLVNSCVDENLSEENVKMGKFFSATSEIVLKCSIWKMSTKWLEPFLLLVSAVTLELEVNTIPSKGFCVEWMFV
jgi:hypothetical protein